MSKSSFTSRFQEWLNDWNDVKTRQSLVVVLAILLGLLGGTILYFVSKYVADMVFPFPPSLYFQEGAQREALLKTVGTEVFVLVPVMWIAGTLAASYIAVRTAKIGQFPAWIASVLLCALMMIDLPSLPSTMVMFLACPLVVAAASYGGGWLGMYVTVQKQMRSDGAVMSTEV